MRPFSSLPYEEQDSQVATAIREGCAVNASELCMWFEQPESEHTEFIAAVERWHRYHANAAGTVER